MKQLIFFIGVVLISISCKDKEKEFCKAPAVQSNLVGAWVATGTVFGKPVGPVDVVFTGAGDLVGSAALLEEIGEAKRVDWTIRDGKVLLSVDYGGINTTDFVLPVLENECRKIRLGEEEVLYLELTRTQ